jgi:Fic family protein
VPRWDIRFDLHVDLHDDVLQRSIAQAEEIVKLIALLPVPRPVASRVNRLNILRAVRGTTGLEGSNLTEEEVGQILDQAGATLGRAREREEQETRNAAAVMQFVADSLQRDPEQPLSEDLIRHLHEMTTADISYANNQPGRYREHNVVAGDYRAPEYEDVPRLMEGLIRWWHNRAVQNWPALVQAVAAHFYFISIHPFGDGNGAQSKASCCFRAT